MNMPRSALLLLTLVACARGAPDADTSGVPARPAGVPADWVYVAPDSLDVEWWAPPGLAGSADMSEVGPCAPGTRAAAEAVIPRPETEPYSDQQPRFATRRGPLRAIVEANHFGVTEDGDYTTGDPGGDASGTNVMRGATWLVVSGIYWVTDRNAGDTKPRREPVGVLLGVADVGDGCFLVYGERGEGLTEADTVAALLRTVRRVPP